MQKILALKLTQAFLGNSEKHMLTIIERIVKLQHASKGWLRSHCDSLLPYYSRVSSHDRNIINGLRWIA